MDKSELLAPFGTGQLPSGGKPVSEAKKRALFTTENAREMGKKGGRASAAVRGSIPTMAELKAKGPELLNELVKAGLKQGKWKNLDDKAALDALKAAVPYILGRPVPMSKEEEDHDAGGFSVGTTEPGPEVPPVRKGDAPSLPGDG